MKQITGLFSILVVAFILAACTTQKTVGPQTAVIGINQYDKEKLGEWVNCPTCRGNGNCTECKGKGKKNGEKCVKCDGTGKCSSCEGQGGWRAEVKP